MTPAHVRDQGMDVDKMTSAVERKVKAKMVAFNSNEDPTEALVAVVYLMHLGLDLRLTPSTPASLKRAITLVSREMMARQELVSVNA